jgi:hypothetical protein
MDNKYFEQLLFVEYRGSMSTFYANNCRNVIELLSHCDDRASRIVSAFVVGDGEQTPLAQDDVEDELAQLHRPLRSIFDAVF